LMCSACPGRAAHPVGGGGRGKAVFHSERSELSGCRAVQSELIR
jgi:hypothetical protein